MNSDLEKNIVDDINKSGYGSEMKAIRTFLSCGWNCYGQYSYFDRDEEKLRRIDLLAEFVKSEELPNDRWLNVSGKVVAEVKKSEKPWVVFRAEARTDVRTELDGSEVFTVEENLPCELDALNDVLSEDSLLTKLGWQGYGIHESFKKPDADSRWYSAAIGTCKAVEDVLNDTIVSITDVEGGQYKQAVPPSQMIFFLAKPIVVLDGILVSSSLDVDGNISIEEVEFASVQFSYFSKEYTRGDYIVDVVTLSGLGKYISMCDSRLDKTFRRIKSLHDSSAVQEVT